MKTKEKKITDKEKRLISITLAIWGILLITSGLIMSSANTIVVKKKYDLNITQKKVSEVKTNEIKVKDITIEISTPLSVDVKDYLENIESLDNSIIKALKLDTSMININQAGTYTYTVSFKKKKYNGNIIVKEKELPKVDIILKNVRQEKDTAISTDLSTYISNALTNEVKNHIILDLSKVVNTQAGIYQYTVTYNGNLYTGTVEIYEPQLTIKTPNTTQAEENKTEDSQESTTQPPATSDTTTE